MKTHKNKIMDYIITENQFKKIIKEDFIEKSFVKLFERTFNSLMKSKFDWFSGSTVGSIYTRNFPHLDWILVTPYVNIFAYKQKLEDTANINPSGTPDLYSSVPGGGKIDSPSEKYGEIRSLLETVFYSVVDDEKNQIQMTHVSLFLV